MIDKIYGKFAVDHNFKTELDTSDVSLTKLHAFNKAKGVSVLVSQNRTYHGGVTRAVVKLRTRGSGYRNLLRIRVTLDTQVDDVYETACEGLNYVPAEVGELPPPWVFSDQKYRVTKRTGWYGRKSIAWVEFNSVIAGLEVLKVMTIGRDHVLVDTIGAPDQDCWYLFDCVGHTSATFNIISDGEVFYPVTRVTESTRTIRLAETSGKENVDLRKASIADKELVVAAIEAWVSRLLSSDSEATSTA